MHSDMSATPAEGDAEVAAFAQSMPEAYLQAYSPEERAEHWQIVKRRVGSSIHVERWRTLADGLALVCVVTDDRPGLLSLICRALVRHGLEVRIAQIYSRRRAEDCAEAVDFFWLRESARAQPASGVDSKLGAVAVTLAELLEGPADSGPRSLRESVAAGFDPVPATRAFFNTKALRRGEYVLVVETIDFPGLLLAITSALHAQGVEIEESDVRTEGILARDCFVLTTPDASELDGARLAAIRQAVVDSVRDGRRRARTP